MGYTIAVKIKDEGTYLKVWEFLSKNYQHPDECIYISDPKSGLILDYDHSSLLIGFDYTPSEESEWWGWAVAKWIAEVAGDIKIFNSPKPIQYLRFDGDILYEITHREVRNREDSLPENLKEMLTELKRKWKEYILKAPTVNSNLKDPSS